MMVNPLSVEIIWGEFRWGGARGRIGVGYDGDRRPVVANHLQVQITQS
jgi:hypothetical protein